MIRTINYSISADENGKTIYNYLKERYFCTKMITHLKHTDNSVLLNGIPVFLNTALSANDNLTIVYSEDDESMNIVPVALTFKIVYEDEDIMVIDKPADMPVHPAINNFDNTLANGIAYYFTQKGERFVFRCINRLDRNTSGLLIIAKHRLSASILSDFMKKREIHREYLALASGIFEEKEGTIDLPIGRVSDSIIERFVDFENGERAITHYKVIREYDNCSLLKITLDTGRTHQIRVHMSYIGHPLLGDTMYNKGTIPSYQESSLYLDRSDAHQAITRQALHSHKIEFIHPITLKKMCFVSEPQFLQKSI